MAACGGAKLCMELGEADQVLIRLQESVVSADVGGLWSDSIDSGKMLSDVMSCNVLDDKLAREARAEEIRETERMEESIRVPRAQCIAETGRPRSALAGLALTRATKLSLKCVLDGWLRSSAQTNSSNLLLPHRLSTM